MKKQLLTLLICMTSISSRADSRPELRRVLDFKSHKTTCVVQANRASIETRNARGAISRRFKNGEFFDNARMTQLIRRASFEPMNEYIHVRESIPNVTVEASDLLVVWSAGHTLLRNGTNSAAMLEIVERVCGPVH